MFVVCMLCFVNLFLPKILFFYDNFLVKDELTQPQKTRLTAKTLQVSTYIFWVFHNFIVLKNSHIFSSKTHKVSLKSYFIRNYVKAYNIIFTNPYGKLNKFQLFAQDP